MLAKLHTSYATGTYVDPRWLDETTPAKAETPADREKQIRAWWVRAFARGTQDLQAFRGARIWAAWRVTRLFAKLKGYANPEETLVSAKNMQVNRDLWHEPAGPFIAGPAQRSPLGQVYEACAQTSLLPPPPPPSAFDPITGHVRADYDPSDQEQDEPLHTWLAAYQLAADYLGIAMGAPADEHRGLDALHGMNRLPLLRLTYPTREEILAFEAAAVRSATKALCDRSRMKAEDDIYHSLGLTMSEIEDLCTLAIGGLKKRLEEPETARAILYRQMDEVADRAQQSLNLTAEIRARDTQGKLLGLTRDSVGDQHNDALEAIRKITEERNDRLQLTVSVEGDET